MAVRQVVVRREVLREPQALDPLLVVALVLLTAIAATGVLFAVLISGFTAG